jgi:hypothetical protein
MTEVRVKACGACPYRRDVPSGVWASPEYDKLRGYDAPTTEQPPVGFACHASPEFHCHGWAVCHTSRGHEHDLLALRFDRPAGGVPAPSEPLFASAAEAADHGQRDVADPGDDAVATIAKLTRRHGRLRR